MSHFIKDTFTQALTTAALSKSFTVPHRAKLDEILIHASTGISETITVTHDAYHEGSNYDTVLKTTTLTSEQDFVFRPTGVCVFEKNDILKIQCTNANATGTVYGKLKMTKSY